MGPENLTLNKVGSLADGKDLSFEKQSRTPRTNTNSHQCYPMVGMEGRNEWVYQGTQTNPMNTLRKAYMFQSECLTMMRSDMQQKTSSIGVRHERNTSWRSPPLGFITLNTDASWSPGTSIHSTSAIARDSQGQPLSGSARLIYALPLLLQKRWL